MQTSLQLFFVRHCKQYSRSNFHHVYCCNILRNSWTIAMYQIIPITKKNNPTNSGVIRITTNFHIRRFQPVCQQNLMRIFSSRIKLSLLLVPVLFPLFFFPPHDRSDHTAHPGCQRLPLKTDSENTRFPWSRMRYTDRLR